MIHDLTGPERKVRPRISEEERTELSKGINVILKLEANILPVGEIYRVSPNNVYTL